MCEFQNSLFDQLYVIDGRKGTCDCSLILHKGGFSDRGGKLFWPHNQGSDTYVVKLPLLSDIY